MPNEYDISNAFKRIENDLMESMMRNLKRHQVEEKEQGMTWEQWQVIQLRELEEYRLRNADKFTDDFRQIDRKVDALYRSTSQNAQAKEEASILEKIKKRQFTPEQDKGGFFRLNEAKLEALIMATQNDFARAEFAMLRRANDRYRQIIFDSMTYANITNDYAKAVDMATHDFLKRGINSVVYKNGARHTVADYASMAIRTGNKRAYLMGEGNAHDRYGLHIVRVNNRTDACPLCVGFLGKLLIDDVYGGGTQAEANDMGIPTLSDAMQAGFLHPNCKDIYSVYIPGVSKPADPWTQEEISNIVGEYNQDQAYNHALDMQESYQRMAKYALDPENAQRYQARADSWAQRAQEIRNTPVAPAPPKPPVAPPSGFVSQIVFDDGIKQEELIKRLDAEYENHAQRVVRGAHQAGGIADLGGTIHISNSDEATAIHEFAHEIVSDYRTRVGLGSPQDEAFLKEARKIHRKYLRETEGDPTRWISTYEHGTRKLDEFIAEAFTQQKLKEYGIPLPKKYGTDDTYSKQIKELIDKHYKRSFVAETEDGMRYIKVNATIIDQGETAVETAVAETAERAFVPASTIEEAEEFAKRFTDTGRFGAVGISYEGVSVDVANVVNKTIDDFFATFDVEPFGGIIAPKGNTRMGKLVDGATAGYSPVRHSFILNRKSLKSVAVAEKGLREERALVTKILANPEKYDLSKVGTVVRKTIENAVISGRGTVPMTIEEVLWHELGHTLERGISKAPNFERIKANMAVYAPKVSGYATTEMGEYIAESFCSYMKGEGVADPELIKAFEALRR